jgi:molybdopterin synthase catalytic subunit
MAPESVVGWRRIAEGNVLRVVVLLTGGHGQRQYVCVACVWPRGSVVGTQLPLDRMESPSSDTWVALSADPLPANDAHDWAIRPDCGAVVLFTGTVRDHAEHRTNVTLLEYEAYTEQVEPKLAEIAAVARERWRGIGRVALLHRVGPLELCEVAVVVVVSAPHRDEAFEAARWCIDTLKATVPIWKKERWEGGEDWGLAATELADVSEVRDQ